MLAHELRNPLAAIGNAVQADAAGPTSREHIDWSMEVITRQMQHLSRLIDDLLDVSRITRGKIELRRDVLDATPILESAAATVGPLVEERKHTLELAIDRGNLWANVDPTRLEQVVVNLLNNAAKYSENGGHIRLSARVEADEVVIRVKDRGSASRPRSCPRCSSSSPRGTARSPAPRGAWASASRSSRSSSRCTAARIAARSEGPGKGSEFIVRLPAAKQALDGPTAGRKGPTRRAAKRARILVVDDNVDTARRHGEAPEAPRPRGGDGPRRARGHRGRRGSTGRSSSSSTSACRA